MIQRMLAIWSLVPLPFRKPAWTSGISRFMYCWSLAWRVLSITLLACEMSAIVWYFVHSLALPFFGIEMKTDLFQSCGHCWVFQICWHIVPLVSLIFLKRSLVSPFLLFSSISLHWSLRKAFLCLLAIFGTLHLDAYIFPFSFTFHIFSFLSYL